jgi:hypothetical protein
VDAHVLIPKDYWQVALIWRNQFAFAEGVSSADSRPLDTRRSKIPNFADDSDEADAIKRTFRDIIQDHARDTSFLASYVKLVPGKIGTQLHNAALQERRGSRCFVVHSRHWQGMPACLPLHLTLKLRVRTALCAEMNNMTIGIGAIKPWILHTDWGFGGVHDDPTPQFEKKTVEIHA